MLTIRTLWVVGLALTLAVPFAASAGPVESIVIAPPGGWIAGYATPAAVVVAGDSLAFLNGDILRHNVVAVDAGPDDNPWCDAYRVGQCPAFWSPLVGMAAEIAVDGVPDVAPGTFEFYCTLHPNMRGALVVAPSAV